MKYKVIQRRNPQNPPEGGKFYANAVNIGKLSLRDFAKEIEGHSSLSRGDILNVLENFLDELPAFLKSGYSVRLGDFGTVRLNIRSEGTQTAADFTTARIKGVRVVFTPGVELKETLKWTRFEQVAHQKKALSEVKL